MNAEKAWDKVRRLSPDEAAHIVNEAFKESVCEECQSYIWFENEKEYHCTAFGCTNGEKFKAKNI